TGEAMHVVLFVAAGILAALIVLLWLVRRPPAAPEGTASVTLRYAMIVPAVGLLGAGLVPLGPGAVLLFASSPQPLNAPTFETYETVGWMLVGFLLIGGPLLLVGSNTRVFVTGEGVTKYSPFWGTASLHWEEVKKLDYSMTGRYTVVRGDGGRAIRVSDYMGG